MSGEIKKAIEVLSKEMQEDEGYAISWHCNLAMMAQDAGAEYKSSNEQAAQFMQRAFGVDTSKVYTVRPNDFVTAYKGQP